MAVAEAVFQSSGASEGSSAGAGDHGGAEDGDEDDDDALSKECAELEDAVEAFKRHDAMLAETVTKLIDFFVLLCKASRPGSRLTSRSLKTTWNSNTHYDDSITHTESSRVGFHHHGEFKLMTNNTHAQSALFAVFLHWLFRSILLALVGAVLPSKHCKQLYNLICDGWMTLGIRCFHLLANIRRRRTTLLRTPSHLPRVPRRLRNTVGQLTLNFSFGFDSDLPFDRLAEPVY